MDLRTKRKQEIDNQKEKRKQEVIIASIEVFKEKGIENTKMIDIAVKSEVGIATVYRYFKTKLDLVIAAATRLWEEEISILYNEFYEETFNKLNGVDKVRRILCVFINIYRDYPEFISFLEHFDNYVVNEQIPSERLYDYEKSIIDIRHIMFGAMNQGKKDGSIKDNIDNNVFYITITHSLMSLCQKLILRGTIIESDMEVSGDEQLNLIIDMAMGYISK